MLIISALYSSKTSAATHRSETACAPAAPCGGFGYLTEIFRSGLGQCVDENSSTIIERESMARNILILGASYGSLLGTKLLMAGHDVTLVCRKETAELINRDGTEVRIKLRDEAVHRAIFSRDLPGKLDATPPAHVDLSRYYLGGPAMQEPP